MLAVGIDPGKHGGVAFICDEKVKTVAFSEEALIELLRACTDEPFVKVCLEKVGAMPGQGVVSMFNFGQNFGFIQGVLKAFGLSYQLVPPQTWKKEFSISSDKNQSIDVCKRLFPKVSLLASEKCRTPHDGMAEALLMAEYARRKL